MKVNMSSVIAGFSSSLILVIFLECLDGSKNQHVVSDSLLDGVASLPNGIYEYQDVWETRQNERITVVLPVKITGENLTNRVITFTTLSDTWTPVTIAPTMKISGKHRLWPPFSGLLQVTGQPTNPAVSMYFPFRGTNATIY